MQLGLVDVTDAQLALDGRDEGRALEQSAGQCLDALENASSSTLHLLGGGSEMGREG